MRDFHCSTVHAHARGCFAVAHDNVLVVYLSVRSCFRSMLVIRTQVLGECQIPLTALLPDAMTSCEMPLMIGDQLTNPAANLFVDLEWKPFDEDVNTEMPPIDTWSCAVVFVTILRARDLEAKDRGNSCDPYVTVTIGSNTQKTEVMHDLDPIWNQDMYFFATDLHTQKIAVRVFDRDMVGKDEQMGDTSFQLRDIIRSGYIQDW